MLVHIAILAFIFLMLLAAWTDMIGYRIPNWISIAVAALWLAAVLVHGMPLEAMGISVLTGLAVLAIGLALWMPGWIGGGDVKLIAAASLWFSWPGVLAFFIWFALAGGVLSLGLVMMRLLVPATSLKAEWVARTPLAQGNPAPYAIAIAAGALIALPQAPLFAVFAS